MQPRLRNLLFLPIAAIPLACSSSSDAGDPNGGGGFAAQLVLDSSAAAATDVTVQVEVVALEREDGAVSPDLLPGSAELDLVRSDGATETLGVTAPPAGRYVAVRLLLSGSEAIIDANGAARRLSLGGRELRIPFDAPIDASMARTIGLRHARAFADPGANGVWTPALTTVDPDLLDLRLATVVAASTSPGGIVVGTLGDRPVDLEFATGAILLRDPQLTPLAAEAFLAGIVPGARLLVDGVLAEGRRIRADAVVDLGPGRGSSSGRGEFGEIRGVIVDIDDDDDDFDMSILEVLSGADRLPSPRPRVIEIDTDDARLVQVTSSGERREIDFDQLDEGMNVVVRWREEIDDDDIDAERVEVFTDAPAIGRRIDGDVESVDRVAGTFVLDPDRGDDDLVVVVDANTEILVRDGLRGTGFDAIRDDRDVVVWGDRDGSGRVLARRIVVRDDD